MEGKKKITPSQWRVAFLILALTAARILYGMLSEHGLHETSALFIGVPALLAFIITLTPKSKSITGMILKAIIIGMLMSGIVLGEGLVCIIMASPIFLAVGLAVGLTADNIRNSRPKTIGLLFIPFTLFSLEGTTDTLSFNREQTIVVTRTVALSQQEVEARLSETPTFTDSLPTFLQLGFPTPTHSEGSGLSINDSRHITFSGRQKAMGQLHLRVNQRDSNSVQFEAIEDTTPIADWLTWQTTAIEWQAVDEQHTTVTMTITIERRLAPAAYFAPLEQFGVQQAANYLIDSLLAIPTEV